MSLNFFAWHAWGLIVWGIGEGKGIDGDSF